MITNQVTQAGFYGKEYQPSKKFTVFNSIIEDGGFDFDNDTLDRYYTNTENKNNFLNKTMSIGYLNLNKYVDKDYYKENTYLFFVVDKKTKEVIISPIMIVDKENKWDGVPYVRIKDFSENMGGVCTDDKSPIYWTGQFGANYNTYVFEKKSLGSECIYFEKETKNWQSPEKYLELINLAKE